MKKLITSLILLASAFGITAQDFTYGELNYSVLSEDDKTCELTRNPDVAGDITIPETVYYDNTAYSVTSIGNEAFSYCYELTSITIPTSVTEIGDYTFRGCDKLSRILCFASNPPDIKSNSFSNVYSATLYVPKGCKEAYQSAPYWQDFANIVDRINEPIFNEDMGDVVTIGPSSSFAFEPAMHSFGPATGVQFDLTLPQGLSLTDVTVSGADSGLPGLTSAFNRLANGDYRVLIYTSDGTQLGDILLGMTFQSDATLVRGEILLHDYIQSIFDEEVSLDDETVLVTGYEVKLEDVELEEGESLTLAAPFSSIPEGVSYRWGSVADQSVASLSADGVITALKPGETAYSLFVKDGDRGEQTYSAALRVIAALWGDADGNGSINVADLVAVANYILERNPENFDLKLADVNRNGRINVVDLTMIVKLILAQSPGTRSLTHGMAYAAPASATFGELSFGDADVAADGTRKIALRIEPTADYTALQADIVLPASLSLESASLDPKLSGHTLDYGSLADGSVRILLYSASLAEIKSGALVELTLKGDAKSGDVIRATNTLASDGAGVAYGLGDAQGSTGEYSALGAINAEAYGVKTVEGGIEVTAPAEAAVRVIDLAGRTVSEATAPARIELPAGVYIVTFDGTAVTGKVLVK